MRQHAFRLQKPAAQSAHADGLLYRQPSAFVAYANKQVLTVSRITACVIIAQPRVPICIFTLTKAASR